MPLVDAWGFGPKQEVDARQCSDRFPVDIMSDSTRSALIQQWPGKITRGVELDFSAIAKGYGVDVIGKFLTAKGY